jgi:hypothetical protein
MRKKQTESAKSSLPIYLKKQDAWRLLEAIEYYREAYSVSKPVEKTFDNIVDKLKEIVET